MLAVQLKSDNTTLHLYPNAFARGGEGLLYEVASPKKYKGYIVKCYHPEKRSLQRALKIDYLVNNPPHFARDSEESPVAWPLEAIVEKGAFVGFLMRKVAGKSLEILCTPQLNRKLGAEWHRFDFKQKDASSLRQKICFNLAVALQHIHASQRYAFVDLKPDNILIQSNGLVSLVDMDSIEVHEHGKLLFAAPVATPEYTPPEFYRMMAWALAHRELWDRFSMGVIFYKVLLGIHPFAASCTSPYEKADSLAAKIEAGLFVHHPAKHRYLSVIPTLHQYFGKLPNKLQDCFMQCFAHGQEQADMRPTAEEWCWALAGEIGQESRSDIQHLPFAAKLEMPDWPALPKWLQQQPKERFATFCQLHSNLLQLNFRLYGPNTKRYWWIGKQTREEWENLQNTLTPDIIQQLHIQRWTLQEQALLAQWLQDWTEEQATQKQFCSDRLEAAKKTFEKTTTQLNDYIRQLNRDLALSIQNSHQQKRQAFLQLSADRVWKKYRGNSLEAKSWHLEQWLLKEQNRIGDEIAQLRYAGEKILNEAMLDIEQNYYKRLAAIEQNNKLEKNKQQEKILSEFESASQTDEVYQEILSKGVAIKKEYQIKIIENQKAYANILSDLDRQFQENLLSLTSQADTINGSSAQFHYLNTQKKLLEAMHRQQQAAALAHFDNRKIAITHQYTLALTNWEQRFELFRKEKKVDLEQKYYKAPLQLALESLQQALQIEKEVADADFLQSRKQCEEDFKQLKKRLLQKKEVALKNLTISKEKDKQALMIVFENYQNKIKAATETLRLSYEQLNLKLLEMLGHFQNALIVEKNQLIELFQTIEHDLSESWIKTFGGIEKDWIIGL